jgi:tetratricopeptide (TPR) repeat protein
VALTNLGTLRWHAGDRRGAGEAWERARRLDPELAAPALNLALTTGTGGADAALEALEREAAKPGAPASVRAEALRARAARESRAKRWVEARALLEEARRLVPWDARVLNDLAVTEDQLGMDREALAHLDEALQREPDLLVARNNVGIVHVHRGAADAAVAAFEEVLAQDPRFHRAHYNLGVLKAAEGDLTAARTHFREAARLAPRDAAVQYNLALVERGTDPAAERRAYERALALDPDLSEAHLALGMLLADPSTPAGLRDEGRAVTHLERFLDLAAPSDGDGRVQARSWLSWLAERRR